jgi:uncharacterized protein
MMQSTRRRALIALALSVPFTSIGATMSLLIAPGAIGQTVLVICQIWLLFLPIVWLRRIERKPLTVSRPKQRDWIVGATIGLLMFCIILAAYWLFLRHWINAADIQRKVRRISNIDPLSFQLGGFYFTVINALIEEYFWRWFIYRRCEEVVSQRAAVFLSASFFTLHHTIGLAVFTDWRVTIVGTLSVFAAGAVWSECYRRYRSVWGNYFSHAAADLALHIIAWQILFGSV